MITFTAPAAAATIREALAITPSAARILLTDNTRTVYCDYTGQVADVEVAVYGPDHYDNLHVTFADVARAVADLTDGVDVDTIEVTVSADWAQTFVTQRIAA